MPGAERWQAYDGQATELEVAEFVAALVRMLKPQLVIESGSWLGYTTQLIGQALQANGAGSCISVEINTDFAQTTRQRCAQLPVQVVEDSVLNWNPPKPCQLAFIDAGEGDERLATFRRWKPWLQGYVLFHDTGWQHSVRPHLEQAERDGLVRGLYFDTPRGVYLGQVQA